MSISIINKVPELFNLEHEQELQRFVCEDLLSGERDINWLGCIIIDKAGRNGDEGGWGIRSSLYDNNNPNIITGIIAVIKLNASYLKTIDDLKETLAHEYGHHWTLSYLKVNKGIDILYERLPKEYYQYRGLNPDDWVYSFDDYDNNWHRFDKEIIAEDYRVLFAPSPFNEDHQMVNHPITDDHIPIIPEYIKSFPSLS